uniref:Large ribosomal subunit protein bL25 beta domain-containing protein n=1 Tax=Cryptomonas curvata TaxID=233186 RepID=A0A7S0QLI0_9CRYP
MATPACLRKKKVEPVVFVGTLREDFKKLARERATEKGLILGLLQDSKGTRTYLNLQDKPIRKVHDTLGFYNTVYPLQVDGQEPIQCIVRSLHYNPIREIELRNIVLLKYQPGNNTRVHIPVQLQNEDKCPGLKKGGVINLVMERITCICNGPTIPTFIALDLSKIDIGHGVMLRDLVLPEGLEVAPLKHYAVTPVLNIRPSRASMQLEAAKEKKADSTKKAESKK